MSIKNDLHEAYLMICKMKFSTSRRVRILSEMMGEAPEHWRVVGITKEALELFSQHDFKKVSRMGINRSHLVDRHKTYTDLIDNPRADVDEWWDFYYERDKTILSTSSENMKNEFSDIIYFDEPELFNSSGFAWRHSKKESSFLLKLFEENT